MKVEEIYDAYLGALDEYIRADILILGRDALHIMVKFRKRKLDAFGNKIRENNSNPILDSRIYELKFPGGRIEEFAENLLAKSLFNLYESDSWDTDLIDEVIYIQKYPSIAVAKEDGSFITDSGHERDVVITKLWDFHIR